MAIGITTNTVQTDGSTVSKGTNITGFSGPVVYDKGITDAAAVRVLKQQFGDGYEMRIRDGINNVQRKFSLTFNNRTKADVDNLHQFFTTLAGVDTCQLTIPYDGSETAIIVVIEEFGRALTSDNYYTLSATAKEVFEP